MIATTRMIVLAALPFGGDFIGADRDANTRVRDTSRSLLKTGIGHRQIYAYEPRLLAASFSAHPGLELGLAAEPVQLRQHVAVGRQPFQHAQRDLPLRPVGRSR